MKVYRIITAEQGIKELEIKITSLINQGWRPVGGVSFNQSYTYQAMIGEVLKSEESRERTEKKSNLGAIGAMKRVDDLT